MRRLSDSRIRKLKMKHDGFEQIIDHMQGLLGDMKWTARQGLQYGEQGTVPTNYLKDRNDILAKVNLFWPFWREKAKEHGVDRVTLVCLDSEMNLAKLALKGVGKGREIA